ncbi:type-1 angiotensin II receptor-associated protein-like [Anopheles funestus]|uniref:Angiotensin II receptor-associated protein n=1 Tax=Anopheles funestus TaxID=62324 RepID=A0A182RL47_ANOFN|nr:type-1 angiotensin II receptor-associated protein-like [Anopheles funestus]
MDIQRAMNSMHTRLKLVAFVHFILIVLALGSAWLPSAYLFYNLLYMVALFWAIHCRESIDAVQICAVINGFSFFFDLMGIISYFPSHGIFSAVFAILNLVIRPFSLLLLQRELSDRGGSFDLGYDGTGGVGEHPTSYEDIDAPHQQTPSHGQVNVNMFK